MADSTEYTSVEDIIKADRVFRVLKTSTNELPKYGFILDKLGDYKLDGVMLRSSTKVRKSGLVHELVNIFIGDHNSRKGKAAKKWNVSEMQVMSSTMFYAKSYEDLIYHNRSAIKHQKATYYGKQAYLAAIMLDGHRVVKHRTKNFDGSYTDEPEYSSEPAKRWREYYESTLGQKGLMLDWQEMILTTHDQETVRLPEEVQELIKASSQVPLTLQAYRDAANTMQQVMTCLPNLETILGY